MAATGQHNAFEAMVGRGVYTVTEAARLLGANPRNVRAWTKARSSSTGPVFHRDYDALDGGRLLLSFQDLTELWVVDHLRKRGMALQGIRRYHQRAAELLKISHPFSTSRIRLYAEDRNSTLVIEDGRGWTDLKDGQMLVRGVLKDYFEHIDFDESGRAVMFWPRGREVPVVVDPGRCYGAPVVDGTRMPARMVLELIKAGDSVSMIASAYGLSEDQVEAARDFVLRAAA